MKARNLRRWVALVALGAHAFVPFAAYASASAASPFGDVCSVFGKARSSSAIPAGLPAQGSDHRGADHCAFCPGGAAAAAVMPSALPTLQAPSDAVVALRADGAMAASVLLLLPPSRAPPTSA